MMQVFVLRLDLVMRELERAAAPVEGQGAVTAAVAAETEQAEPGMRLAVLTTLVQLLEKEVLEMEGEEEGTGSLERDEQLAAVASGALSPNQRHALLYRIGQKRLGRAYLVHARRLMQGEMERMRAKKIRKKCAHRSMT